MRHSSLVGRHRKMFGLSLGACNTALGLIASFGWLAELHATAPARTLCATPLSCTKLDAKCAHRAGLDLARVVTPRSVRASSFQTWRDKLYRPNNAADGSYRTAWVENAKHDGVGSWWQATAEVDQLAGIAMLPGFAKNTTMYKNNPRPKRTSIVLQCADGQHHLKVLWQDKRRWQWANLPKPVDGPCTVRIIIDAVFPGERFKDLSIAEVLFWEAGSS